MGQLGWLGRIYGKGVSADLSSLGGRVYQGVWAPARFQSLYEPRGSRWSLALAPEWYLMIGLLSGTFVLSIGWGASIIFGPALLVAVALLVAQASISARRAKFVASPRKRRRSLVVLRLVVVFLHLMQPMARLSGRIRGGLTPWRRRGPRTRPRFPRLHMTYWRGHTEGPRGNLTQTPEEPVAARDI